jgi:spore coat polysaccharide biosynthesis protein SpsF (cytidylyltransferase family)
MNLKLQSKKKVTIMIQARTGSNRLPRKVLTKIEKLPMIVHVLKRVKKIDIVDQIVLITTRKKEDEILVKLAKENDIMGFTGDENDVLSRHYQCAVECDADPIIRITGDCPLIDPMLVREMLVFYLNHDYDYVSNTLIPTYPDGLDVEIFSFKTLRKLNKIAKKKSDREHVTSYIKNNTFKSQVFNYKNALDLSHMRWTVDERNDLRFVRKIFSEMRPKKIFSTKDVLQLISKNPKILQINQGIKRNEGYLVSLKKDKK